ncbi:MAG: hypothetical protein AAB414_00110 [Patescibacteria group bacterium]
MNKKIIMTILLLSVVVLIWYVSRSSFGQKLTGPGFSQTLGEQIPDPTPPAPVAPKTFQFDASTDLEAELEKINPEVLDSDFE